MPDDVTYTAQIPYTGPEIGRVRTDGGTTWVAIRCGHDPALGEPLLTTFIPVKKIDGKWEAVDSNGNKTNIINVAWVQAADPVVDGQFTIDAPVARWQGAMEGVLILLVYEQPEGPPSQVTIQGRYRSAHKGRVPREPTDIGRLDPSDSTGIRTKLDERLRSQDPDKLEDAVIRGVR